MNCIRGFQRITLLISIIGFFVTGTMSYFYLHRQTEKELPERLKMLDICHYSLDELKSEVESDLSEKKPVRLSTINLLDSFTNDISRLQRQVPPAVYYYNIFYALAISTGVFFCIWIAYYVLRYSLIRVITPLLKWLKFGFSDIQ